MKLLLNFGILIFAAISCKSDFNNNSKEYKLIQEEGIYVEVFDSINIDQNRYTKNNHIYKEKFEFVYSYEHFTKNNVKYLFAIDTLINDRRYAWKFVNADSIDDNTILKVKIKIKKGLQPMIEHIPNYNQTLVEYSYLKRKEPESFNSISGLIENEKNIWIHPPRDKYFRILELNPFPFIKEPYEIGNKWKWGLRIGDIWGDERWVKWKGVIENKYTYEIKGKNRINTVFGKLDSYIIEAEALSRIGKTQLTAFFHPEYGFLELLYTNIDGSKTRLKLEELIKHN
ncbi:hypothetical protein U6A24_06295 [Aquimarina gracilis]|uniref:Uncharacterized protein n=1 Tax=Aquimarina gracilis TaxID=874422 RepID=A0ABU5ZUY7_9FLAO|nr:hypothetical protein [Aquimarina gracilis]MEB3345061.1 hypothetical protein [Aquimarina gracilis]